MKQLLHRIFYNAVEKVFEDGSWKTPGMGGSVNTIDLGKELMDAL